MVDQMYSYFASICCITWWSVVLRNCSVKMWSRGRREGGEGGRGRKEGGERGRAGEEGGIVLRWKGTYYVLCFLSNERS